MFTGKKVKEKMFKKLVNWMKKVIEKTAKIISLFRMKNVTVINGFSFVNKMAKKGLKKTIFDEPDAEELLKALLPLPQEKVSKFQDLEFDEEFQEILDSIAEKKYGKRFEELEEEQKDVVYEIAVNLKNEIETIVETAKTGIAKKPKKKKITKKDFEKEVLELKAQIEKLAELIGIKTAKNGYSLLQQAKKGNMSLSEIAKQLSSQEYVKEMIQQDILFEEVLKKDKEKSIAQKAIEARNKALAEGKPEHVANKLFWATIEDWRRKQQEELYKRLGINYYV